MKEEVNSAAGAEGRGSLSLRSAGGSVVMMTALRAVDVGRWRLGRRSQLAGEHNTTGFVLLGQMFGNLGMERFDIADHAKEKPA